MIAGENLGQFASKRLGLLLGYRRNDGHSSARPSLANDPVPQKDKPVIDVGDMGFIHVQRQFQMVLQKRATLLADFLGLRLRPFDDDDEVIGIAAIGEAGFHCRFSRTVMGRPC